jgi:WD40 repeat protein
LLQLGIFPYNENIPYSIIEKLWGLNDFETEERLLKFHNLGLIDLSFDHRHLIMHDVVLQDFKENITDAIPCHKNLCANLADFTNFDSPYAWKYYSWHLKEAGDTAAIHSLLKNFSWLRLKLFATDINELLNDFEQVELTDELTTIASVLQLAAHILVDDKMQLVPQLIDRLGYYNEQSIKDLVADALEWQSGNVNRWLQSVKPTLQTQGYLQRRLKGHTNSVKDALIMDDKLLSLDYDSRLLVWDLHTGSIIHTLKVYNAFQGKIIIDKYNIITWLNARTLGIFDLISGELIHTLSGHSETLKEFLLYQNMIISWSEDKTIILWDLTTGKVVNILKGHFDNVNGVIVHDDTLISWSKDKSIKVWDLKTGQNIHTLITHTGNIWQVIVHDDNLYYYEYGGAMHIWSLTSEKQLGVIPGGFGRILTDLIHEGILISSFQSYDNEITILDLPAGKIAYTLHGHTAWVVGKMRFNDKLISWSKNGEILIWDLKTRKLLHTLIGHTDYINGVIIKESHLISSSDDHTLRVWDIDSGKLLHVLEGHADWVEGALVYQNRIVSYSRDHTINIWDLDFNKKLPQLVKQFGWINQITICNKQVISSAHNKTLCIWDSITGRLLHEFRNYSTSTAFLISQDKIICPSLDGSIHIINRRSYKIELVLEGHNGNIPGMIIQGDKLVSRTVNEICVWELPSGKKLHVINAQDNYIAGFIVHGNTIISWTEKTPTLNIFDLDSGKLLRTITGEFNEFYGVLGYQDQLICWSGDKELNIWELATGKMLAKMIYDSGVVGACLYQDKLIHWTSDNVIYITNLQKKAKTYILDHHSIHDSVSGTVKVHFHKDCMISWVDNDCSIWDTKKWRSQKKIQNQFELSAVTTCNDILYLGDSSGKLTLFETTHFTAIASYYMDSEISTIQVDTDTQRIIVGDHSGRVHFLQPRGFIV